MVDGEGSTLGSRKLFYVLVALLAGQRLVELRLSKRNEKRLVEQGGREHAAGHFRFMRALHTGWFVAMVAEVGWLRRPFRPVLAAGAALATVVGQLLRYAAIGTLGRRWTVRIITVPGLPPVRRGIYRYLRHPNYLGVMLEIAAVPLLHTAYLTSLIFSVINAVLLRTRICAEEEALAADAHYLRWLGDRPRFLPRRPAGRR